MGRWLLLASVALGLVVQFGRSQMITLPISGDELALEVLSLRASVVGLAAALLWLLWRAR